MGIAAQFRRFYVLFQLVDDFIMQTAELAQKSFELCCDGRAGDIVDQGTETCIDGVPGPLDCFGKSGFDQLGNVAPVEADAFAQALDMKALGSDLGCEAFDLFRACEKRRQ